MFREICSQKEDKDNLTAFLLSKYILLIPPFTEILARQRISRNDRLTNSPQFVLSRPRGLPNHLDVSTPSYSIKNMQ
ncbi:hypothetical protein V1478_000889 [Vespula squamosa]|uniref:Uncharacterized protein n=1 Tax=Vespula squamosa TaxID=30214 RepID=A0ABD2C8V5_VESSQ